MDENETTSGVDETTQDAASKPSLKDKIKKIDAKKWGKRAAVAGVVAVFTVLAITVVRNSDTEVEE